jgi:hypothetical protein
MQEIAKISQSIGKPPQKLERQVHLNELMINQHSNQRTVKDERIIFRHSYGKLDQ